jgi:hypothetical protein
MTKVTSPLFVASLLATVLHHAPAQALNTRSFVSANGVDTNPCTQSAPCRTLQKAHDSTDPGGEIKMLDPADYGTVIITKSISIVNDGVGSAGILVPSPGTTGIAINAGASDKINLRGLIIDGAGLGNTGILFNSGGALTIENCIIRNLGGPGIDFVPNTRSSLAVSNTYVAHTGNSSIKVGSGGESPVTAILTRVEMHNSGESGLFVGIGNATGSIQVTVADSVAAGHSPGSGFQVTSIGGALTSLMVVQSVAFNNGAGLVAIGVNAILRVSQSTVTGNGAGWAAVNGGVLQSYADNNIDGNGTNELAPPVIAKK